MLHLRRVRSKRVTAHVVRWAIATGLVTFTSAAHAEPSAADRALATELFRRGRDLLAADSVPAACEALGASHRLDPSGGTILNLALCHEREGRTATAWSEYQEAISFAKRDGRADRLAFAEAHLGLVAGRLARLRIVVGSSDARPTIVRDGSEVPEAGWGVAVPIDPGRHVVEARGPGRAPLRIEVSLREGEARDVSIGALAPLPADERPLAPRVHGSRLPVYALGIGSLAAATTGTIAAVRALRRREASDAACTPSCTADGVAYNEQAKTAADVSTIAFAVAVAAAAGAVTWLLLEPRSPAPRASVAWPHF